MMSFSELRDKEVVNMSDGKRLGFICDLELSQPDGRICSIVVPAPSRMFGLIRPERDYVIPWNQICKIGEDVVLVQLDNMFFARYKD